MEVKVAGKTIYSGDNEDIWHLFNYYEEGLSNTIPQERAKEYLKNALALQKVLKESIRDLRAILTEYEEE